MMMERLKNVCNISRSSATSSQNYGNHNNSRGGSHSHNKNGSGGADASKQEEEDDEYGSETDRDTVEDLEAPQIPQQIEVTEDGVTSIVTPISMDFRTPPSLYNHHSRNNLAFGSGDFFDPNNPNNGGPPPLLSKRQIGGGLLCLLCIAVLAFVTPFYLTRDIRNDSSSSDAPGVLSDDGGGTRNNDVDATATATDDTTTTIVPVDIDIVLGDSTEAPSSPTVAPPSSHHEPTVFPTTRTTTTEEPLSTGSPSLAATTIAPTTTAASSSGTSSPTPSSSSPIIGMGSIPAATQQQPDLGGGESSWIGLTWSPCIISDAGTASGGSSSSSSSAASVLLTCQEDRPLTLHRFSNATTLCKPVNATTVECQASPFLAAAAAAEPDGEEEEDDEEETTAAAAAVAATALVSCASRVTVRMPLCHETLLVTATTGYHCGDGDVHQWRYWNATACANDDQSGSALLAEAEAAATQGEEDEDGGGGGGPAAWPDGVLDDFFHILWDGIDEDEEHSESEHLSFCYSQRRCDDNSIFCAASPLRAEAAPAQQEACSSSNNDDDDDLEEAWNALLEASPEVVAEMETILTMVND